MEANDTPATIELSKLKGIVLCSLNVRGLLGKIEDIRLLLRRSQVDALLLSETFLHSGISDAELAIEGYTMSRLDRAPNVGKKGGGGLVAYTTTGCDFEYVNEWETSEPNIEAMWLKLKLKDTRDTYICNMYRAPDGTVDDFLTGLETKLDLIDGRIQPDIIVMGDANIDVASRTNNNAKNQLRRFLATI